MEPITGTNVMDMANAPPQWSLDSPAARHWYERFTSTRRYLLPEASEASYSVAVRTWRDTLTRAKRSAAKRPLASDTADAAPGAQEQRKLAKARPRKGDVLAKVTPREP